jgi:hypothetical protein
MAYSIVGIYIYNVVMLLSIKEILVFVGSVKNQL